MGLLALYLAVPVCTWLCLGLPYSNLPQTATDWLKCFCIYRPFFGTLVASYLISLKSLMSTRQKSCNTMWKIHKIHLQTRQCLLWQRLLKRSIKCVPLTIQSQMHNFGKGTVGTNRSSKHGRMIKVNSPATSRRTFKVPGRGPAPLGRPLKDRSGRVQMFVSEEDGGKIRQTIPIQTKEKTWSCQKCEKQWNCTKTTHKAVKANTLKTPILTIKF